jgi:hypothetical protein
MAICISSNFTVVSSCVGSRGKGFEIVRESTGFASEGVRVSQLALCGVGYRGPTH